jgi:uncharacterized protein YecT (DUF1311 family)
LGFQKEFEDMKSLVLFFLAAIGSSYPVMAEEARSESNSEVDCSNPTDTVAMTMCAQRSFDRIRREMNHLYTQKMKELETDESKAALRDSQRAWRLFLAKACVYEVGKTRGPTDTYFSMNQTRCAETHTKQRIQDLKSYIACTDNGCPT